MPPQPEAPPISRGFRRSGGHTVDEWSEREAQMAHVDAEQYAAEVEAQKAATVQAAYDIWYFRTLRANGIGLLTATALVMIHAATDCK